MSFEINGKTAESVREKWDIGVVIADNCKVSNQCSVAAGKANRILGMIKRNFVDGSEVLPLAI